ncbi:dTDP-4-dehydrorhamnose 3,5-epimerase [Neobacillus sp. Marseille-QA0830]
MNNKYEFFPTPIEGVLLINPFTARDERGFVKKTYEKEIFLENQVVFNPVEEMETTSKKGVIRGLHFQTKFPQAKLVRCVRGKLLDVVVDLRRKSPTFGKSFSTILSSENRQMLYVPKGFAHGCLILQDDTTFYYLSDNPYYPEYDSGIVWNDPDLGINWNVEPEDKIILSEKDKKLPSLQDFLKKHSGF